MNSNDIIMGTCSACGGPMTVPMAWCGVIPPTPTCQRCGAVAKQSYGRVIDVIQPKPTHQIQPNIFPQQENMNSGSEQLLLD